MNTARAPEGAKIVWIGPGKMGLRVCERLAAHAFPVTALTRSADHRERAARVGVRSASGIVARGVARTPCKKRVRFGPSDQR
jgi:3-hydroxyisobutyrate dehydrogenase-like beta-hydroxyacid dehydrogenase